MPLKFSSTQVGSSSDYMKYLWGDKPKKVDQQNNATLLDFSLAPVDSSFVRLTRGAYITLDTVKYPKWFTGYVTNEPELQYLGYENVGGVKHGVWGYKYEATSDEYVLNLKPIGIIDPFVAVTAGSIVKSLINLLVPGVFDVTNVQDGIILAQYVVDPTKKFQDVIQDLCKASGYMYYAHDHKFYFLPQSAYTGAITLDSTDTNFTPSKLTFKASTAPIINDVTVLGDLEPQDYITEYFVGTGLDGSFPLTASVFGADESVLLDETFSNNSISDQWQEHDSANNNIQVSNGYLNVIGGSANGSYDVYLQATDPIPLEGRLRLTHGEWDFVQAAGKGVICGLWSGVPSSQSDTIYPNCLYALQYINGVIKPIVGDLVDSTQSFTVDTSKRYVIRTVIEFSKTHRANQSYTFLNSAGVIVNVDTVNAADNAVYQTYITEIDVNTAAVTKEVTFRNTDILASSNIYQYYIPVASDSLHATFTGITISVPINATLETSDILSITNPSFDDWISNSQPTGWGDQLLVSKEVTIVNTGNACRFTAQTGQVPQMSQPISNLLSPNVGITLGFWATLSVGANPSSSLQFVLTSGSFANIYSAVNITKFGAGFAYFTATFAGLATVPNDVKLWLQYVNGSNNDALFVDDLVVTSEWQQRLIGPNDIDAMDGRAPVATIVASNVGANTSNSYFGNPQFNAGQSQLVFFKDSVTQTSNQPPQNQLIRVSYRAAGPAAGRVQDTTSITSEAAAWGDDGVRSVVHTDLVPRPRNSAECELAASATVLENGYQHYEGTYQQYSEYFDSEPKSGSIITFLNFNNIGQFAEEVSQVTTTFESNHPIERFIHEVTFGKPDHIQRLLAQFNSPAYQFQKSSFQPQIIPVDVSNTGVYSQDVVKPVLIGYTNSNLVIDTGQDLGTSAYFEVRYTDSGWGQYDGKNLIARSTSRIITIPRTLRGKTIFIRQVDKASPYGPNSRYSSCVHVSFPAPDTLSSVDLTGLLLVPRH